MRAVLRVRHVELVVDCGGLTLARASLGPPVATSRVPALACVVPRPPRPRAGTIGVSRLGVGLGRVAPLLSTAEVGRLRDSLRGPWIARLAPGGHLAAASPERHRHVVSWVVTEVFDQFYSRLARFRCLTRPFGATLYYNMGAVVQPPTAARLQATFHLSGADRLQLV